MNRREFNKSVATAAAAIGFRQGAEPPEPMSANDKVGLGFIGVGNMGQQHIRTFLRTGQVEVLAIADPYQPYLDEAVEITLANAKGYKDFRSVLDRKDIDAVVIATPEHRVRQKSKSLFLPDRTTTTGARPRPSCANCLSGRGASRSA